MLLSCLSYGTKTKIKEKRQSYCSRIDRFRARLAVHSSFPTAQIRLTKVQNFYIALAYRWQIALKFSHVADCFLRFTFLLLHENFNHFLTVSLSLSPTRFNLFLSNRFVLKILIRSGNKIPSQSVPPRQSFSAATILREKDQWFVNFLLLCFCKPVIGPWALRENNALRFSDN